MYASIVLASAMAAGCKPASAPVGAQHAVDSIPVESRTIKLPYRAYGMAYRVGDALYLNVDSGTGRVDSLIRYDLSKGTTETIFTSPSAFVASVIANDRWLLWESDKRLFAQPLGGGKRMELASTREMYAPAIEGDTAAWVDWEPVGNKHRIVTCDLRTGVKTTVAQARLPEFYNNFMQIKDGKLLWTDIYGGTGHYLLRDLATGKTSDYPVPETQYRYPGYAKRDGEFIYSINFDRFDEWDWSRQRVMRYSISSGDLSSLTTSGAIGYLEVGSGGIAIIDDAQRLLVGPADESFPRIDMSAKLGARMDGMKMSSDGKTLIAGNSTPEKSETTLYMMTLP